MVYKAAKRHLSSHQPLPVFNCQVNMLSYKVLVFLAMLLHCILSMPADAGKAAEVDQQADEYRGYGGYNGYYGGYRPHYGGYSNYGFGYGHRPHYGAYYGGYWG